MLARRDAFDWPSSSKSVKIITDFALPSVILLAKRSGEVPEMSRILLASKPSCVRACLSFIPSTIIGTFR